MVEVAHAKAFYQGALQIDPCRVRDDPKLLDDSGEVFNFEWNGWRFDSQL